MGSLATATGCVRNTIKEGFDCFDSDGTSQSAATSPPSQSAPPAARGFANQKVTLVPHDHVTAFIVAFIPLVIDDVSVVALPLVPLVTLTPLATPATLVIFTACIHWPWFRSWWSTCMRSAAHGVPACCATLKAWNLKVDAASHEVSYALLEQAASYHSCL